MLFIWILAYLSYNPLTAARGCRVGTFGEGCRYLCMCDQRQPCVGPDYRCPRGCLPGWIGDNCHMKNVAYLKNSYEKTSSQRHASRLAVDEYGETTCSGGGGVRPRLWMVDLGQAYAVYTMFIVSVPGSSLRGLHVYVSQTRDILTGELCSTLSSASHKQRVQCDRVVVGRYVAVLSPLRPLRICDFTVEVCSDHRFGRECASFCHCADRQEICNKSHGLCLSGCASGWSGNACNRKCNHTYGRNCRQPCGKCKGGVACDTVTGICPGCRRGWTGHRCNTVCKAGSYGPGCSKVCRNCAGKSTCDHETGHCPIGCRPGWSGTHCDTRCMNGYFGLDCQFRCGHCQAGTSCNPVSGTCLAGCAPGYRGVFCTQECRRGWYGNGCRATCGHCGRATCRSQDGTCPQGCQTGWVGRRCHKTCSARHYGNGCKLKCGICADDTPCRHNDGTCSNGCQRGWQMPLCQQECARGTYGKNCSSKCGKCQGLDFCDPVAGDCPNACSHGYSGSKCQDRLAEDKGSKVVLWISVMGAVVAILLCLVIVCFVCKWRLEHKLDGNTVLRRNSVHSDSITEVDGDSGTEVDSDRE